MPLNFSGVDEHRIIKFSARFGLRSISLVTKNCPPKWAWSRSHDVLTFWQISMIFDIDIDILKTVQNRDIRTMED